ncbi:MAG: hypothetical protein ACTSUR_05900 [Candidatus Heimdallarchaeaceae archaeon]
MILKQKLSINNRYGGILAKSNSSSKRRKASINEIIVDNSKEPIKDFSQTKDIVKALSSEIGVIVEQFLGAIYNVDVAERFADSILVIYKKLKDQGISQAAAEKILCEYSANLDKFASMLKKKEE